jgi:hypothetical protein
MPNTVEEYRGYIIKWDVTDDRTTGLWKGTGVVQIGGDAPEPTEIHSVPGRVYGFKSGDEARDHIIRTAKEWIDQKLERTR